MSSMSFFRSSSSKDQTDAAAVKASVHPSGIMLSSRQNPSPKNVISPDTSPPQLLNGPAHRQALETVSADGLDPSLSWMHHHRPRPEMAADVVFEEEDDPAAHAPAAATPPHPPRPTRGLCLYTRRRRSHSRLYPRRCASDPFRILGWRCGGVGSVLSRLVSTFILLGVLLLLG